MVNSKVSSDVVWHASTVTSEQRQQLKGHRSFVLWFTGLSASGKSTLANAVENHLLGLGKHTYLLDGDNIRHGLNGDLGFSNQDREENIRRVSEVAKLFVDSGIIILTAFISPSRIERERARSIFAKDQFVEIYINTPLSVCEQRDPKGLYKKARAGEIQQFTGLDSSYEPPNNPEIIINTAQTSLEQSARMVIDELTKLQYLTL